LGNPLFSKDGKKAKDEILNKSRIEYGTWFKMTKKKG